VFVKLARAQPLRCLLGKKAVAVELVKHQGAKPDEPIARAGDDEGFVKLPVALHPLKWGCSLRQQPEIFWS
jgi:hypothetical protein